MSEKWIWLDNTIYPEFQSGRKTFFDQSQFKFSVATFLKTFELKENALINIKIAADTRYLLKSDGELIARAQGYMGGDYAYTGGGITCEYDTFLLPKKAGLHEIKVDVLTCPQMTNELSLGKGGLCVELTVKYENGKAELFVADDSWFAFPNAAYPGAWQYAPMKYNPTNTKAMLTDNARRIVKRRSPLPEYFPITIKAVNGGSFNTEEDKITIKGKTSVRIDLGKIFCLYTDFDVVSKGIGRLKFNFAEVDKTYLQYTEILTVEKGSCSFEPFHYHSARYVDIESDCDGEVVLIPKLKGCFYPMQERGSFSCSDENLNKIYEACTASVRLCLKEEHLDSPVHQEPLGTIGDYKIDSLVEYNAFGLYDLTKADIVRTAEHLDKTDGFYFHTTYALIWVDWIRDYLLYSGDLETVRAVLPTLRRVIDRYWGYLDEEGLVSNCPNFMFLDWVNIDGHSLHHPPKVLGQGAMSCFTYNALNSYAKLLFAFGDERQAQDVKEKAARLKKAINEHLWDEKVGLYIEGLTENDKSICEGFRPYGEGKYYGVYTNTLAVAFGVAENGRELMQKLVTDKSFVEPQFYFYHYYLVALRKVGLFEKYGFSVLNKYQAAVEKCPSGLAEFRIDKAEDTKISDGMTPDYRYDFSHGWGATPAYHCYSTILGVQPTQNGFREYTIEPNLGNLTWAKGRVPTPNGTIEISVRKVNGELVKEVRYVKKQKEKMGYAKER